MAPNTVMYTVIIVGYGRLRRPRAAEAVFDEMLDSGIEPDWGAVDATAWALFRCGLRSEAKRHLLSYWQLFDNYPHSLEHENPKIVLRHFRKLRANASSPHFSETHVGHYQNLLRRKTVCCYSGMERYGADWAGQFQY